MQYLVYTTTPGHEPRTTHLYSIVSDQGLTANGKTVEELRTEQPHIDFELIDEPEFLKRLDEHYAYFKTDWKPVSKSDWWDLLECLPPCRWHNVGGIELFHVSERLTGDLVTWCMRNGDSYYTCTQEATMPSNELVNLPILEEAA